jgi:hypothetical protein
MLSGELRSARRLARRVLGLHLSRALEYSGLDKAMLEARFALAPKASANLCACPEK